jgi:hypothetical protein
MSKHKNKIITINSLNCWWNKHDFPGKWHLVFSHTSRSSSDTLMCSPETSWWLTTRRILHPPAWSWSTVIHLNCKGNRTALHKFWDCKFTCYMFGIHQSASGPQCLCNKCTPRTYECQGALQHSLKCGMAAGKSLTKRSKACSF